LKVRRGNRFDTIRLKQKRPATLVVARRGFLVSKPMALITARNRSCKLCCRHWGQSRSKGRHLKATRRRLRARRRSITLHRSGALHRRVEPHPKQARPRNRSEPLLFWRPVERRLRFCVNPRLRLRLRQTGEHPGHRLLTT